jgi:hypothetical protein
VRTVQTELWNAPFEGRNPELEVLPEVEELQPDNMKLSNAAQTTNGCGGAFEDRQR